MQILETLWLNITSLIEEFVIKRTDFTAGGPDALRLVVPLVGIGLIVVIGRGGGRTARYVAFTAVCGAAFYFLLRVL